MSALLIDLDGVIYESDTMIAGAAEAVAWVREQGIPHQFLTNTTSRPRSALVDKLDRLGVAVTEDDLLTPAVAASRWLAEHAPGPAALFVAPATVADFRGLEIAAAGVSRAASVVVGDYGERWSFSELNRAFRLLMEKPQPVLVALGMTRYWKADDGLRLDTAPFVSALAHASGADPVVLGKPARAFFEAALARLDATASAAVMVGDDIRGDVAGAQAAGMRAVLVRTGKFRPEDLDGDIQPDAVLDSIADLPGQWTALASGG